MPLDLDTAVERFEQLATKELRRWFPEPNNCIGAVRIVTQVFQKLGFEARPFSVVYQCHNAARKMVYISGTPSDLEAVKERARRAGTKWIDLPHGTDGWQGHVVAIVGERWWIDPTWTAAGEQLGIPADAEPIVFRIPEGEIADDHRVKLVIDIDNGQKVELHYSPAEDLGYLSAPAWELDHVDIAIEIMRRKILGTMKPDADIEHFVVYRRPDNIPGALFSVRRFTLSDGNTWPQPDQRLWAVLEGSGELDDEVLKSLRQTFRSQGRYRLDRLKASDPSIVEVWI